MISKAQFYSLFFINVILSSYVCFSQVSNYTVYRKQKVILNKAMFMMDLDSLSQSESYFKLAMKQGDLNTYYSIQALYLFSLVKNEKYIVKVLKQFPSKYVNYCNELKNNCAIETEIMNDSIISNQIKKSHFALKQIEKLRKRQQLTYSKKERLFFECLNKINTNDQLYRKEFDSILSILPNKEDSLSKILEGKDSVNFIDFISLLKYKSWPKQSKYGSLAEYPLWHCNIEEEYLEELTKNTAKRKELDWEVYEHFIRRSNKFVNALIFQKKLVLSNLVLKKSKFTSEIKAQLHFLIDCFNYYNIKPENVHLSFNSDGTTRYKKLKLIDLINIFEDYDQKFANVKIIEMTSSQYLNNQIIITIDKSK